MHKRLFLSVLEILVLCIVIALTTLAFINHEAWMGFVLLMLSALCIASLLPFGIKITSTIPDVLFGIIDNGILAIMAIFGGYFGGIAGAVLGGVVGNAITDGIAGIFEGYVAEKLDKQDSAHHRSMLKSSVGKMSGCLLGAGVVLIIAEIFGW